MKLTTLLLFTLFIGNYCFSQLSYLGTGGKGFEEIKGSTLNIVLTGNEEFDAELKKVMDEVWNISKFKYISSAEFNALLPQKDVFFMVLLNVGMNSQWLAVLEGGRKNIGYYNNENIIVYGYLCLSEEAMVDATYRLRNLIESMLYSMKINQENRVSGNVESKSRQLKEIHNKKSHLIKNRTLLFCREHFESENIFSKEPFDSDSDFSRYPYKYNVCTKDELTKIIADRSEEYYYVLPTISNWLIIDPSNGEIVYCNDFKMLGMKMTKKVDKLVKTIESSEN